MHKLTSNLFFVFICSALLFLSCSKGGGSTPPTNPCASKTIVVTGSTTPTTNPSTLNGSINAAASGSTGFTYNLNGGIFQTSGAFTGLGIGNYTIIAKDADGCTGSQIFAVTATPCPTITVTATITPASTPAATNGVIAATATGSTGLTYNINGGAFQASGTFSSLGIGNYTIIAKDATGCTGSAVFVVTAASCPTITLTATGTNTSGPTATNGSIAVSATGGATPYTFSKDGGATYQATTAFTNLAVGSYSIKAKDANGCESVANNVNISSTCPTITANTSITNTIKCESNSGSITITASGSTGLTYNLNGGTFQASNIFSSLAAGNFSFGVKDANGCTTTGNVTVSQAPAGTLFSNVKALLAANCVSCHGGAFPQNGLNFADDCTIVAQGARIKARAVDANPSQMPPSGPVLSGTDKQKIIDWLAAGGKHNN